MAFFDMFRPTSSVPTHVPSPDQDRELLLFKTDFCPYCLRVFRAVEGLDIEVPMADLNADRANRQTLLDRTGRTTVPCLFIDGEPLFESLDIIAWLEAYAKRGAEAAS